MSAVLRNAEIRAELALLRRENRLTSGQADRIAELYPPGRLDPVRLARWLSILGALCVSAGAVVWLKDVVTWTLATVAWVVGVGVVVLFALAGYVRRVRRFERAGLALELLASLALTAQTGLLTALVFGADGNWPLLFGVEATILLTLAYVLVNPLVLVAAIAVVLFWAGAQTGYAAQWGAYWVGMSYPLRFVALGAAGVAFGAAHLRSESAALARYRGFGRVWSLAFLLAANFALWLLSMWGNVGDWENDFGAGSGDLLVYNLLWAVVSGASVFVGTRTGFGWLTASGMTFAIIQAYTLFFVYVAGELGWFLGSVVAGGSLIGLGVWLERRVAGARSAGAPAPPPP